MAVAVLIEQIGDDVVRFVELAPGVGIDEEREQCLAAAAHDLGAKARPLLRTGIDRGIEIERDSALATLRQRGGLELVEQEALPAGRAPPPHAAAEACHRGAEGRCDIQGAICHPLTYSRSWSETLPPRAPGGLTTKRPRSPREAVIRISWCVAVLVVHRRHQTARPSWRAGCGRPLRLASARSGRADRRATARQRPLPHSPVRLDAATKGADALGPVRCVVAPSRLILLRRRPPPPIPGRDCSRPRLPKSARTLRSTPCSATSRRPAGTAAQQHLFRGVPGERKSCSSTHQPDRPVHRPGVQRHRAAPGLAGLFLWGGRHWSRLGRIACCRPRCAIGAPPASRCNTFSVDFDRVIVTHARAEHGGKERRRGLRLRLSRERPRGSRRAPRRRSGVVAVLERMLVEHVMDDAAVDQRPTERTASARVSPLA